MYADEPLLDCHANTTLKLGHDDLNRSLAIRCTGRAYPPADVIAWTWSDVILASDDVIDHGNVSHVSVLGLVSAVRATKSHRATIYPAATLQRATM